MSQIKENATEAAVRDALTRFGIRYDVVSTAPNSGHGPAPIDRDGWKCYPWRATFSYDGKQYAVDYFTGIGHVTPAKYSYSNARPVIPTAAQVLHSLLLDSSAASQTFNDWCADRGMDSDSIKALSIYQACCDCGEKLRKMLTHEQRAELETLLQDY